MTRPVPGFLSEFIRQAEALVLTGQRDIVGKPTWGYGHTGPDVVLGGSITPGQAETLLYADLVKAAVALALAVKPAVIAGLTEHQYAALVSFVFNLGTGDPKKKSWVIWQLLNAGQLTGVPVQMLRFDHGEVNGREVEIHGLYNRRAAEAALWKTADLANAIAIVQATPEAPPSSSATQAMPTPPVAMGAKPTLTSKSVMSGGAAGLLALATPWLDQVKQAGDAINAAITPYVGDSDVLKHLQGELMFALAAAAAASAVFAYLKNRETH